MKDKDKEVTASQDSRAAESQFAAEDKEEGSPAHGDIEALQEERDEWRDRCLRTMAELQNYRKRTERSFQDQLKREKADVFRALLEVVDNYERFLGVAGERDSTGGSDFKSFLDGATLIYKQILAVMSKEGVEPIPCPVGQQMDPALHEAFLAEEGGGEHGTVLEELQKGYVYGEMLLRPTRVKVAR